MSPRARRLCAALSAAIAVTGVATGATASASPTTRSLPGSVPVWAAPANRLSDASGDASVGFRVYLSWRDGSAAEDLARAVSTPGSASYGKFVSSTQFRQQFAPSASDASAVQQWLRRAGFTVDYTPGNNRYVQAEGTVAQASAAFSTSFGVYTVKGATLRSPDQQLSIPANLPASVYSVVGLDESAALVTPSTGPNATPSPAFVNAPPCSSYFGEKIASSLPDAYGSSAPYAPCGYTPAQLRGAYGISSAVAGGTDGSGQTVAIIDAYASPTILQDVNQWSANRGIPQLSASQFRQVTPPGAFSRPQNSRQDPQGWYGEETLDVEAVHGMAPGANIVYVGSPNNYQDLDAAMNHVVDNHLASIVTNSYGFPGELLPTGYIKPFNDTLIEAAATGIGVYFSSGDSGDQTGGVAGALAQPDWPAVSPWVTAVGGTALGVGANNDYLFEAGWETGTTKLDSAGNAWTPAPPGSYLYGSGGGTSRVFAQPSYQTGVVPNAIATAGGSRAQAMRTVPDVAAIGDPQTGMLIGQTQSFPDGSIKYSEYRIGGTSLASPIFAGVMAVAQQNAGHAFGFANPLLYSKAGSGAFRDVVPLASPMAVVRVNYNNSVDASAGTTTLLRTLGYDAPLTIHVRPGYDDVTGIGTPNGSVFLAALQ